MVVVGSIGGSGHRDNDVYGGDINNIVVVMPRWW